MTQKMTLCTLPGSMHPGVMDYGEVAPADVIAMARRWAANDKARAEEILAATDSDFRVALVEGIHKQRPLKLIQEGRAASCDTHPKGGDAKQAPCASMGSAVPREDEADAQKEYPNG